MESAILTGLGYPSWAQTASMPATTPRTHPLPSMVAFTPPLPKWIESNRVDRGTVGCVEPLRMFSKAGVLLPEGGGSHPVETD